MRRAFYTLLLAALIMFGGELPQTDASDSPSVACATLLDGQAAETGFAGEPEAGAEAVAAISGRAYLAVRPAAAALFSDASLDSLERPPA